MPKEKDFDESQEEVVALENDDENIEKNEDVEDEDIDEEVEEEETEEEDEDEEDDEEVDESDIDDDDDETDTDDETDEDEEDSSKKQSKPAQTKEENAKYAAARRESEKKERDARKKLDLFLQASGYSSYEEFINSNGLTKSEEEKLREEAEEMGYDADEYIEEQLDDKYIKTLRQKEKATRLKEEADKAQQERIKSDLENFKKNYPTIKVTELVKDEKFAKFAKGKTESQSLLEIYEDYTDLFGTIRQETTKKIVSKEKRTTGSGGGTSVSLNSHQRKMMKEWNERYPDRKLTAEDFK